MNKLTFNERFVLMRAMEVDLLPRQMSAIYLSEIMRLLGLGYLSHIYVWTEGWAYFITRAGEEAIQGERERTQ